MALCPDEMSSSKCYRTGLNKLDHFLSVSRNVDLWSAVSRGGALNLTLNSCTDTLWL